MQVECIHTVLFVLFVHPLSFVYWRDFGQRMYGSACIDVIVILVILN